MNVPTPEQAAELAAGEYRYRPWHYVGGGERPYCVHSGADGGMHFSHSHATELEARECCAQRRAELAARILAGAVPVSWTASGRPELNA